MREVERNTERKTEIGRVTERDGATTYEISRERGKHRKGGRKRGMGQQYMREVERETERKTEKGRVKEEDGATIYERSRERD